MRLKTPTIKQSALSTQFDTDHYDLPAVRSLRRGQRDGGVVLSRVVSFSAGAPAGGFLAPV